MALRARCMCPALIALSAQWLRVGQVPSTRGSPRPCFRIWWMNASPVALSQMAPTSWRVEAAGHPRAGLGHTSAVVVERF